MEYARLFGYLLLGVAFILLGEGVTARNLLGTYSAGYGEGLIFTGKMIFITFLLFGMIKPYLISGWNNTVTPFLKNIQDNLQDNTDVIKKGTNHFTQTIDTISQTLKIGKYAAPTNIHEHEERLLESASNMFGAHVYDKEGFFKYVMDNVIHPYTNSPYKTDYHEYIELRETDKSNINSWTQITTYKIHTVLHDDLITNLDIRFPLRYDFKSYCPQSERTSWLENMRLRIAIDNNDILTINDRPSPIESCKKNGSHYGYEFIDDFAYVYYCNELKLNKSLTDVKIHEQSWTMESDKTYTVSTYEPVKRHTCTVSLPDKYKIVDYQVSPEGIYSKTTHIKPTCKSIRQHTDLDLQNENRKIYIRINDWVLPGVVFTVHWE